MAEKRKKGQDYILEVAPDSSGSAGTYVQVGYLRTKGLTRGMTPIDVSSDNDPDNEAAIAGMRSWGINAGGIVVYDDAGQVALDAAFDSNEAYWWRLKPVGTAATGQKTRVGRGWLTQLDEGLSTNEAASFTISVKGDGTLTTTTAA